MWRIWIQIRIQSWVSHGSESRIRQGRYCRVPGGNIIPLLAPGGADAADEDPRGGGAQDARVPLPVRAVSQAVQQAGGHQEPLQVGLHFDTEM
jgi:hypothetical protein